MNNLAVHRCRRSIYLHDDLATRGSRAATASIAHLKTSGTERAAQHAAVTATKSALREPGLPVLAAEMHIGPVTVGHPDKCKQASDLLLDRHGNPVDQLSHVPRAPSNSGSPGPRRMTLGNAFTRTPGARIATNETSRQPQPGLWLRLPP